MSLLFLGGTILILQLLFGNGVLDRFIAPYVGNLGIGGLFLRYLLAAVVMAIFMVAFRKTARLPSPLPGRIALTLGASIYLLTQLISSLAIASPRPGIGLLLIPIMYVAYLSVAVVTVGVVQALLSAIPRHLEPNPLHNADPRDEGARAG